MPSSTPPESCGQSGVEAAQPPLGTWHHAKLSPSLSLSPWWPFQTQRLRLHLRVRVLILLWGDPTQVSVGACGGVTECLSPVCYSKGLSVQSATGVCLCQAGVGHCRSVWGHRGMSGIAPQAAAVWTISCGSLVPSVTPQKQMLPVRLNATVCDVHI